MGSSPSVAELPGWARSLLDGARVARLGLLDSSGAPRVLPITFAVLAGKLVSAIDAKPKAVAPERLARLRWIQADPRAVVTVDHYEDDWSALAWVQLLGEVAVVEVVDWPEAVAALAERYEAYAERPPDGPLLVLTPDRLVWWRA